MVYPAVMTSLLSGVITAGEILGRNTVLDMAALHHYLDTLGGGKDDTADIMPTTATTTKEAVELKSYKRRESITRQTSQG